MLALARSFKRYEDLVTLFAGRVFVPIVCYADESGTHDATGSHIGAEVAVVAGIVSWKGNWDNFTRDWLLTLHKYEVPDGVFHMADLAKEDVCLKGEDCESPYHHWPKEKRQGLVSDLVPIISKNAVFGIASAVDVRAYHELAPAAGKEAFEHPYHMCFQGFFDALIHCIETRGRDPFPEGERIQFFFDQQDEFEDRALVAHSRMKKSRQGSQYLGGITFEDKAVYIPLQAADLVAFRMRKVFTRMCAGKEGINPGSWDDELGKRGNFWLYSIGRRNLEGWKNSGREIAQVFRYANITSD